MAILDRPLQATFPNAKYPATHDMLLQLTNAGVFSASGSEIAAYADAADQMAATGLAEAPRVDGMPNKYFADNTARLRPEIPVIYVWVREGRKLSYAEFVSDMPTAAIISPGAANWIRSHWTDGQVAQLYIERMDAKQAGLMSFGPGPHIGYPIAKLIPDPEGGIEFEGGRYMSTMPSDYVPVYVGEALVVFNWDRAKGAMPQPVAQAITGTGGIKSEENVPTNQPVTPHGPGIMSPTPVAPVLSGVKSFEGMDFNTANGEAIVNGIATGWYFERVVQALPTPGGNPDTDSTAQLISPWAFATIGTADKVKDLIKAAGVVTRVVQGDKNERFPTNVQQLQLEASLDGKTARVNAGLIAAQIARTTFYDAPNRREVQSPGEAIAQAVTYLKTELGQD